MTFSSDRFGLGGLERTLIDLRDAAAREEVPFMLVVGAKEVETGTVAVRRHGQGAQETASVAEFVARLKGEVAAEMGRS